mgnify:CR=1 FL=1
MCIRDSSQTVDNDLTIALLLVKGSFTDFTTNPLLNPIFFHKISTFSPNDCENLIPWDIQSFSWHVEWYHTEVFWEICFQDNPNSSRFLALRKIGKLPQQMGFEVCYSLSSLKTHVTACRSSIRDSGLTPKRRGRHSKKTNGEEENNLRT